MGTGDNLSPRADNLGDVAVILLDLNGNVDFISQKGYQLLGYDPAHWLGRRLCDFCRSPETVALCQPLVIEVLEGRRRFALATLPEGCFSRQAASPLTLRIEPRFDGGGAIAGCLCLCVEADRHRDLAGWQHSQAFAAAVLDNTQEAIVTIDTSGTIFSVNLATEVTFGYRREELLGQNIQCLMPPDSDQHDHYLERYLGGGDAHVIGTRRELTGRCKDGSLIPLEVSVTEVELHGKRGFTGVLRDISDRRAAAARRGEILQAREHLQQLDGLNVAHQLATGIAHEINQPLATIGTYAHIARELLDKPDPDAGKVSELLEKIDQQTRYAAQIIQSLRSLMGKSPGTHEMVDINLLIEQTVELARQDLASFDIDIVFKPGDNLPEVDVIYVQIQQVILNLVRNSRDALCDDNAHPRIEIESRVSASGAVTVVVRDNGDGIAEADAEKIFAPFYSTRKGIGNMGMGLTSCQSIIESHGGVLALNKQYNDGAEFYFTLPAVAQFKGDSDE